MLRLCLHWHFYLDYAGIAILSMIQVLLTEISACNQYIIVIPIEISFIYYLKTKYVT